MSEFRAAPASEAAPTKPKRTGLWLGVIAALVIVAGGVFAAAILLGKGAAPVVESVAAAQTTRLVTPETLQGQKKITMPEVVKATEELRDEIKKEITGDTSTIAAAYGDEKGMTFVVGASAPVVDPAAELDEAIKGLDPAAASSFKTVDAGAQGGVAKCGTVDMGDAKSAVCGWADKGSIALVLWMDPTGKAHTAAELHTIRAVVQQS